MNEAPQLVVRQIDVGVRPVQLRLPFRFGAVTLKACPQLFIRATVEVQGKKAATGFAAEMMVPKWFDKRDGFSHAANVAHLADSVRRAADAYLQDDPASAFGLFARHYPALMNAGSDAGATELSSAYGQAVLDRAVLDGLCRALNLSFFDAMSMNFAGLRDDVAIDDLRGFDWNAWLPALKPLRRIDVRHTIGLLDRLSGDGPDDLPTEIARHGLRVFKIKLGGDPTSDAARLAETLSVLTRHAPGHRYTLDGNEQYRDVDRLGELFERMRAIPEHAARPDALLYVEQPVPRELSLSNVVRIDNAPAPLLLDEADGTLASFQRGAKLGWRGVSSKACKGIYKSIVNRARCDVWNDVADRDGKPRFFMSAEDLTCQAGLSVQQDLALLSLLSLTHSERNGHHYVDGFANTPTSEARAFGQAHDDLYVGGSDASSDGYRLRIEHGSLRIDSLFAAGFAHHVDTDWSAIQPLSDATAMV